MQFRIVDDGCSVTGTQGTVIVESTDVESVGSTAAKQEVLKKATAMGLSRPGISGQGGAYPVDDEGKEITDMSSELTESVQYRNDFQVTSGI